MQVSSECGQALEREPVLPYRYHSSEKTRKPLLTLVERPPKLGITWLYRRFEDLGRSTTSTLATVA
jgi:hypothetical protein